MKSEENEPKKNEPKKIGPMKETPQEIEAKAAAMSEKEAAEYNNSVMQQFKTGFGGLLKLIRGQYQLDIPAFADKMNLTPQEYTRMEKGGKPLNKPGFVMYALESVYPQGQKPEYDPDVDEEVLREARRTFIVAYDLALIAYGELSVDLVMNPARAMEAANFIIWLRAGKPQPERRYQPKLYDSQGERVV